LNKKISSPSENRSVLPKGENIHPANGNNPNINPLPNKTKGKGVFVPGSSVGSGKSKFPSARSFAKSVFAHIPPSLIEPGNGSQRHLLITRIT